MADLKIWPLLARHRTAKSSAESVLPVGAFFAKLALLRTLRHSVWGLARFVWHIGVLLSDWHIEKAAYSANLACFPHQFGIFGWSEPGNAAIFLLFNLGTVGGGEAVSSIDLH